MSQTQDRWAKWLLETRFGGDEEYAQRDLAVLRSVRDRILDNAGIREGDVLLDVGAGDGLVGFGAVDRVGPSGRIIFSDVSAELVERCTEIAAQVDGGTEFDFVVASAQDLSSLEDASVDVVTTRSVLIYVADKDAALGAFHRVLRPGGRISLFEPINKFNNRPDTTFWGYDDKVMAAYHADRPPLKEDPLLNFDERDLCRTRWFRRACPRLLKSGSGSLHRSGANPVGRLLQPVWQPQRTDRPRSRRTRARCR